MNKFILVFGIILYIIFYVSCSPENDNEEELIVICQTEIYYKQTAQIQTNMICTYKSENEKIASVNQNGTITAHNIGETNIIVSSEKQNKIIHIKILYQYNYIIPSVLDFSKWIDYVREHEQYELLYEYIEDENIYHLYYRSNFNNKEISINYTFHHGKIYKIRVSPGGDNALDNLFERYDEVRINNTCYLFYGNDGHRAVYPFHELYIDYFSCTKN